MKQHEIINTKNLPQVSRTLLEASKSTRAFIKNIIPEHYFHFGLKNGIKHYASAKLTEVIVSIGVGVDGLSLAKNSNSQFWPISLMTLKQYFQLVCKWGVPTMVIQNQKIPMTS